MPIKKFLQGEVLTADEVNQYLMDQTVTVFADVTARNNAFGGAGEPVLSEGRFCYLQSTNSVQFYDGSSWQDATQFTVGDGTITTAKLADDAVTGAKIADNSITAAHIADGTIVAADIADGSVTSAKILDGTILNADINASAAIDLSKLADATIKIETASYTLQLSDKNKFIKMNITSTANTVTVPLDSTVTFPEGAQIHIIQYGSGKTEIVGASGAVYIYRTPGSFLRAQYSSATLLKCAAANTWMLMGDLSAS